MAVYIIAEAGVNHNGDLTIAKKLIDMACNCGADAIKFQTFKAEESTGSYANKAKYQKENMKKEESQLEMIKKLELPFEAFKILKKYCKEKNIDFISTPDGSESLNFLISLGVDVIKIGSTEISNPEFLKEIGFSNKEIILSTGMSYLSEVEKAINAIKSTGNNKIKIMQCTTDYPCPLEDVNIRAMVTMKDAFKLPVGFSDHTLTNEAAIAATTLGAEFIEKHITLNKNMIGPDHKASMDEKEFSSYIKSIRNTEKLLGTGLKEPSSNELLIMKDVRRSIVASYPLTKGMILKKSMISFKRPGTGLSPEIYYTIIGRTLKNDIDKDQIIKFDDFI